MRESSARFLAGAALLVAGFGVLTDGAPLRLLDFKDRQCRNASVAVASACPAGCEARPARSPQDRFLPTECHSRLWVRTCGKACDPAPSFVRLEDGRLADARRLLWALEAAPTVGHEMAMRDLRATAEPRFDGLYRYEVALEDAATLAELKETKKRLAALPGVISVDYLYR